MREHTVTKEIPAASVFEDWPLEEFVFTETFATVPKNPFMF